MAQLQLMFIKKSALPVPTKGKAATTPKIAISDKGQMILNPVAVKFLNGNGKVALAYDPGSKGVYFFKADSKTGKGSDPAELIEFKAPKVKDGKKSKGNVMTMSFGTALQDGFGPNKEHKYDYKNSGNQSFDMTTDEKNGYIMFTLPTGALPKRPSTPRKPRAKKVQVVNGGMVGGGMPPVTSGEGQELVLE